MDICGNICGKISAINLKEVNVTFNKAVDKDSAENEKNYSVNEGLVIDSAALADDDKTVTLTLTSKMTNQKEYKLSVRNIADGDKKFSVKDVKFTPLDVTLPTVDKVEALGNKAVKITFSEPIDSTTVSVSDFKIDDKSIAGSVDANDSNTIIVKTYSALSSDDHTIKISGVNDFAGYSIVTVAKDFSVTEDKVAPTITAVKASYEYATVTFSEDVQNVRGGSYAYWKNSTTSSTKHYSSSTVKKIDGKTFRFDFNNNKLPGYAVQLYIEGVTDYSGNVIAKDTPVEVNAEVDQIRPEVKNCELDEDTNKKINVEFTKAIDNISERARYTLKDSDGNPVSISSIVPNGTGDAVAISLYTALSNDTYTLSIEGLKDKTTLANVMLPYTTTFEVGDSEPPAVDSISKDGRYILIKYTESMSTDGDGSIGNLNNYFIQYNGGYRALPDGTSIDIMGDADTVMIILPEKIGGNLYDPAKLTAVTVQRVEDAAGNVLDEYSVTKSGNDLNPSFKIALDSSNAPKVKLIDSRTITVEFNQNIGTGVDAGDFALVGSPALVESVSVDGSVVTLTLDRDVYRTGAVAFATPTSLSAVTLKVNASGFKSIAGTDVTADAGAAIKDKVKPTLASGQNSFDNSETSNVIKVFFNEAIDNAYEDQIATDLIVKRINGTKTLTGTGDYTTAINTANPCELDITIKTDSALVNGNDSIYTVELKDGAMYAKDMAGNSAEKFGAISTSKPIDYLSPIVEGASEDATHTKVTLTFSEALDPATVVAENFTGAAGTPTVSYVEGSTKVTLTYGTALSGAETIIVGAGVTDVNGNAMTAKTLTRGTDF